MPLTSGFPHEDVKCSSFIIRPVAARWLRTSLWKRPATSYTAERVDFKNSQQTSPAYLAINPKGRVPALVTDRGVLTENAGHPHFRRPELLRKQNCCRKIPYVFAQAQSFNSYLCATVHINHAHKMRGYRWASEETSFADMKRKVPETMAASFALIEREMLKGPWVMGEQYTVCDAYLFTLGLWLEGDGVDLSVAAEGGGSPQAGVGAAGGSDGAGRGEGLNCSMGKAKRAHHSVSRLMEKWWARGACHRARIRATRWLCPPYRATPSSSGRAPSRGRCRA